MKHIITTIIILLASLTSWAQDENNTQRGFHWFIDAQTNIGTTFQTGPGAVAGYTLNRHVFLGLGANIFLETYDGTSYPVYLDGRFTLHKEPSSPVIDFRVGCDCHVNCQSLLMVSAAYGYRIAFDKVAITPLIGLKITDDYNLLSTGITIEF